MRQKKIVILDVSCRGRVSPQVAEAAAALFFNELTTAALSLPPDARDLYPTYCWLDEFQRMVGPDLELAIPILRQVGVRLMLAHQSFSQLKRADADLTSLIWQCQTRFAFGNAGPDADQLAAELAAVTWDDRRVHDEIYTRRQLVTGHRIVELENWSDAQAFSNGWQETHGRGFAHRPAGQSTSYDPASGSTVYRRTAAESTVQDSSGSGSSSSATKTSSHGVSQTLEPVYEQFRELAHREYVKFEQHRQNWCRDVRKLRTGTCLHQAPDDPEPCDESRPGELGFDLPTIRRHFPELMDAYERLIEENFQQDYFVSPAQIEVETRDRLNRVLSPTLTVNARLLPTGTAQTVTLDATPITQAARKGNGRGNGTPAPKPNGSRKPHQPEGYRGMF